MKIGFVSAILPNSSFEKVMKVASELHYDCVEIMCWPKAKTNRRYAGVTHIQVEEMNERYREEIMKILALYKVEISALGYYPNPLCPKEEMANTHLEHIKKVIKASAFLGIGKINTFIGKDWNKTTEENWPAFLKVWPDIIKFAEDNNVKVGIENCPMLFTRKEWPGGKNLATTPEIWERMFEAIPSDHFGLNYDPSHMVWQQMDPIAPIRLFGEKLFHIHAKDARIDREKLDKLGILAFPNDFHTPKLPGLGDVNWGKFFSALTDAGYNGPVCVEVEDRAFEGSYENRIRSLKISHQYLHQYIA